MTRAGQTALATPYPDPDEASAGWQTSETRADDHAGLETTAVALHERDLAPILGRYRLCRRLGAGGFGTVWLAWDERLERDVALKLLPRERIASGRFEREARAAARLNHPGIVVLYEAVVDDEGGYLVSELVRGDTLARLLAEGRLSDRDIVHVAIALCDALQYAHAQGVVHRDVKPSNVLMPDAPSSSAGVAKLTDFGVARLIGGDALTRTGDLVGTTAYMAPEQAAGREADASADLYALALVLYEALTGVNPVRSYVRGSRLGVYLPALRRHRRDLPRELACAVDLALRPRPRERGSVPELREALETAIDQVDDEPGVVTPAHLGATASPGHTRAPAREGAPISSGYTRALTPRPPHPDTFQSGPPGPATVRTTVRVIGGVGGLARLLAALSAAAATAWFAGGVLSPAPVVPAVAVLAAGLAVAALPRTAWLVLAIAGALLLVLQGSPGGAIVLAVAALSCAILLFRHPGRWSLPAAVPPLAAIGLGGLWPALAGRAASAWERMVLGAAGWLWLLVGSFLIGHGAYVRLPAGTPPPRTWMPSLQDTVQQVLHPLLYSGILAPALVWGAAALVLPALTARRVSSGRPAAWLIRGGLLLGWAGAVVLLTRGVLAAAAPGVTIRSGPALLGAFSSALAAGLDWPWTGRRAAIRGSDVGAGLA